MPQRALGKGPLSGVRVTDLTSMVMGLFATQIMADKRANSDRCQFVICDRKA